jgi:hypothetical protein
MMQVRSCVLRTGAAQQHTLNACFLTPVHPPSRAGAFAGGAYDEDDKEADEIWEAVDKYMDERRRVGG